MESVVFSFTNKKIKFMFEKRDREGFMDPLKEVGLIPYSPEIIVSHINEKFSTHKGETNDGEEGSN